MSAQVSTASDNNDTLAGLLATATVVLDTDRHAAKSCIQRVAALLGIDLGPEKSVPAERSCLRGGLAPWQAKRIRSYIEDNLGSNIRATDLAGIVQLSTSHFFRAFRNSFGVAPLAYIMKRRILRAQEMMLSSRYSLLQIALECGMCDQAHFTRVFRRIVGINPKAWRRQFLVDPPPDSSIDRQLPALTAGCGLVLEHKLAHMLGEAGRGLNSGSRSIVGSPDLGLARSREALQGLPP